jgi:hypothetical protein
VTIRNSVCAVSFLVFSCGGTAPGGGGADTGVADADGGEGFAAIELYGPGASLIYAYDCRGANPCSFQYTLAVTQATYVTARATQTDGDYLVGAPIWAQP